MLSKQQISLFKRNGFVNGGAIIEEDHIDDLCEEVLRVIDERELAEVPQPVLCRNLSPDEAAPIWQIVNIYEASPAFNALVSNERIAQMAAQLTDAEELRIWHDQIQYKPQARGGRLHWHQDSPAWPTLQPKHEQVTAWVALDDADQDNGCMYMVPGSHRWGDQSAYLHAQPNSGELPHRFDDHSIYIAMCPVKRGHVHFHHSLTWHGSGANVSNRPRRAIAIHLMTEKTTYDASGDHPMKKFISVQHREKLVGDAFPLVWQKH